jgi:hypothetical protein
VELATFKFPDARIETVMVGFATAVDAIDMLLPPCAPTNPGRRVLMDVVGASFPGKSVAAGAMAWDDPDSAAVLETEVPGVKDPVMGEVRIETAAGFVMITT